MSLLKKENWIVCFLLNLMTQGTFSFVLGYMLKVYDKNAWYTKWYYWGLGGLCLLFPAMIMLMIFEIQIQVCVAKKLDVPGKELYASPYTWIICLIVPVVGWIMMLVMMIYVVIWPSVMVKRGEGEKFVL